jgi:hypothetical protein
VGSTQTTKVFIGVEFRAGLKERVMGPEVLVIAHNFCV